MNNQATLFRHTHTKFIVSFKHYFADIKSINLFNYISFSIVDTVWYFV